MSPRQLLWFGWLISWLTAFIIRKGKIRRYMPAALFASQLVSIVYVMAYHLKWWKIERPTIPWLKSLELTYIFGPFLVGTIWVFTLTYRFGFRVYMVANIVLDSFFSFVILPFYEKMGIVTLKNISRAGIAFLMIAIALVIFPFQKWQDSNHKKRK